MTNLHIGLGMMCLLAGAIYAIIYNLVMTVVREEGWKSAIKFFLTWGFILAWIITAICLITGGR